MLDLRSIHASQEPTNRSDTAYVENLLPLMVSSHAVIDLPTFQKHLRITSEVSADLNSLTLI